MFDWFMDNVWLPFRLATSPKVRDAYIKHQAGVFNQDRALEFCRAQREAYQDLLGSIWLYIKWQYVTKQLTTEEKNLFADAVDAASARMNDWDPDDRHPVAERWWLE